MLQTIATTSERVNTVWSSLHVVRSKFPVERFSVKTKDRGRSVPAAADLFQDVQDVAPFDFSHREKRPSRRRESRKLRISLQTNTRREVVDDEAAVSSKRERALDTILKLPHVSRPAV